jgi:hypothetical protein
MKKTKKEEIGYGRTNMALELYSSGSYRIEEDEN